MARIAEYILLASLILLFIIKGLIPAWQDIHSDFPNYYTSSRLLIEGEDISKIYDSDWFQKKAEEYGMGQHSRFSPFPPATAFLMLPIAWLEPLSAKRIWTALNLLVLVATVYLLRQLTQWNYMQCGILLFLTGIGLVSNFRMGQFYLILTALIILSHILVNRDKDLTAGIILGICAALKYFPAVFVLVYVLNGKRHLLVSFLVTVSIIWLSQLWVFGIEVHSIYFKEVLIPHLFGTISGQGSFSYLYQSWESLLKFLFLYDPAHNPNPFLNLPLALPIMKSIVYLTVIGVTIWTCLKCQLIKPYHKQDIQIYVVGFATLVLLPASATYHFLLLTFPVALFLIRIKAENRTIFWSVLLAYAVVGFIPYGFIFGQAWAGIGVVLAYPRLLIVTFIFLLTTLYTWKHLSTRKNELSVQQGNYSG